MEKLRQLHPYEMGTFLSVCILQKIVSKNKKRGGIQTELKITEFQDED